MTIDIQLDEQLINANNCAALFGVSAKTWRRWVAEGKAPEGKYIARTDIRWRLKDVRDMLAGFWEDPSVIFSGTPSDMSKVREGKKRAGRPRKYIVE